MAKDKQSGLDQIRAEVSDLIRGRTNKIQYEEAKAEKYRAGIAEIDDQIGKVKNGDFETLSKLDRQKNDLRNAVIMCESALNQIRKSPEVSEQKYRDLCDQVADDLREKTAEYIADQASHAKAMYNRTEKYRTYIKEVNELLYSIQYDLYGAVDVLESVRNWSIDSQSKRKAATYIPKLNSLIAWGEEAMKNDCNPERIK